ncbi:MAG: NAD-dependent epimerase/dehydratase family protein [Chloroflexi bacterium]|nr:NAD-dependent epimerase/dehydratase family protein [Chloroflexota bacterium]
MSLCLVTGAAGFVGSTLSERLLTDGHTVVGIDCFTDYYARDVKESNLATLRRHPRFTLIERNLATGDLSDVIDGVDAVFHQAGQPGVLPSWGRLFDQYVTNNIIATQRLLEALKGRPLQRFVFASSSTVYGETPDLPVRETSLPRPIVPYGVTKLAAEHLVNMYHLNFGLPAVILRYFSVYGPRQRPDMALHKFINAIARGETIQIRGDGEQTRDATYVDDIVEANVLALRAGDGVLGSVFNIGGGESASVNQIIQHMEQIIERAAVTTHVPTQPGELRHQWANTSRAHDALGFAPHMPFSQGLRHQIEWQIGGGQ